MSTAHEEFAGRSEIPDLMPLNIAMLGTGAMAARHSGVLAVHAQARLVTVCSTDRSRRVGDDWVHRFGYKRAVTDAEELLRDPEVEAVWVCSPDTTHPTYVARALSAGKHVFCEKPLARTQREFELVREAAGRGDRILQVGMNCRYREQYSLPKQIAESGELGALRFLRGVYLLNKVSVARAREKAWWLEHPPGILFFLHANGVHILDLLRWYGGEVKSVFARASGFELGEDFRADTFSISMQFANGALGELLLSSAAFQPPEVSLHAWFERGSLLGTQVYRRRGDELAEEHEEIPVKQEVLDLELQLEAFLEAVASGAPTMNSLQEAYQNFLLIHAIETSLKRSAPVELDTHLAHP